MEWLSIGEGSMGTNVNLLQRVWLTEVINLKHEIKLETPLCCRLFIRNFQEANFREDAVRVCTWES